MIKAICFRSPGGVNRTICNYQTTTGVFENAMHCICTALWLDVPLSIIEDSVLNWQGLDMRLQLTAGKMSVL